MEDLEVALSSAPAALEHLPLGAVVVPARADERPWANAAARSLVSTQEGLDRLVQTVATSEAVVTARAAAGPASAVVQLSTGRGVVERELWAAPVADGSGAVVVTFHADADVRAAGAATTELVGRLEAMLEHTVDIITVLDRDGRILFSNGAAGSLTGFTGDAASGREAFDFLHPDDVERAAEAFAVALETPGLSPTVELRVRFADDTWHDVDAVLNNLLHVPSVGGVVVTLHDVTDRRRAERLVAENEARLRSWVEHLSDVIVVLDERMEIVYTSPAISRIIDAPPETNVGQNALNDIHPDDLEMVAQTLADLAASPTGTTVQVDLRLEARPGSGQWRRVEATAVNRLADPAVAGIVCTLRDVTEQRAAAAQLQAAYDRERSVSERLRELDRLKDDFLATVSHELRTPLSVIVGFSDLLQRPDLDRSVSDEAVERIRSCAVEMRGMVENLLAFSALEAGRVAVSPVRLPLAAAVATTANRMAPLLVGHDLTVDVPADLVVWADPDGFEAVLRNLLTNAAKYSEPGTPIDVRGSGGEGTVALEVEDHGAGIAADQLELVFERLYRAPGAAFLGRGTGVGLNAARRYAELMGGTVSVRSERGVGSTFTVTLPAAPSPVDPAGATSRSNG